MWNYPNKQFADDFSLPNAVLSCRALRPDCIPRGPSPNHVWLPLRGQFQHNVTCQPPNSVGPPIRSVFKLGGCAGALFPTRQAVSVRFVVSPFCRLNSAGLARWVLRLSLRTEPVLPDSRQFVPALRFLFSCRQGPPCTAHRPARRRWLAYDAGILTKHQSQRQGFPELRQDSSSTVPRFAGGA